jgi:hypothetical protein
MSLNNRKSRGRRVGAAIGCGLLIVISLITFQQQISTSDLLGEPRTYDKIYDKEWISAIGRVADTIPQNETMATIGSFPQVTYFTDRKVIDPWVKSESSLVQFMWKNNCSYLLVSEGIRNKPNNTPLLIEIAEKPFEIISDYYDEYMSQLKAAKAPSFNTSEPKPDNNTRLSINRSIKDGVFEKLFEQILDFNSTSSTFDLYRLRSNITRDNLNIVTDKTRPVLFVSLPINGTIMESEFSVLRVNVTGTAIDADSNIKKVEVSIGGLPFKLANPRAPDDWSTWSFSDIVTEGTKRIMVRATDNADNNKKSYPLYITIK